MTDLLQYSNHKPSVDDYFIDGYNRDFNYKIFQELTELTLIVNVSEKRLTFTDKIDIKKGSSLDFTPLIFFNLLYHEYDFILENYQKPLSIIPRLKGISISFLERLYFYGKLSELLNFSDEMALVFIGKSINNEYLRIWNEFTGGNLIKEIDLISDEDKNAINEEYSLIMGNDMRLEFLVKKKYDIIQLKPHSANDLYYLEQIEALIRYNKELKDLGIGYKEKTIEIVKEEDKKRVREMNVPKFVKDYIETIFDYLKEYFPVEQQDDLKGLLCGKVTFDTKLKFMDNGNKLADAFRQLYDNKIIINCKKSELEEWIFKNFQFKTETGFIDFRIKYLGKIISSNESSCKNPIFNLKFDKIKGRNLFY